MLGQDCKKMEDRGTGQAGPLRDDHIVLLAIDGVVAVHAAFERWRERRRTLRALAGGAWRRSRDRNREALAKLDDSELCNLSDLGRQVRREARRELFGAKAPMP
jgi:uncharacterized protein YjiS (DUF1127 family)